MSATRGSEINDLTSGPIASRLVRFAVPLFLGSLIQQLYSTVDMIFVGRAIGSSASASVGASSIVVFCALGLFIGLGAGTTVITSQAVGRGDASAIKRVVHTAAGLVIVLATTATIGGIVLSPFFLDLLNTPREIFDSALTYMRLYFASVPFIVSFNVGAGVLRAFGNSREPMLFQLAGGIANVFANALFISVLGLGIAGAACATIASQGLASALTVRRLSSLGDGLALRFRDIRVDGASARAILSVGLPAALQSMTMTISNMFIQAKINLLGVAGIAGAAAYFRAENVIYLPIVAMGQAAAIFTGQNYGAGDIARVRRGVSTSLAITIGMTGVLSALSFFFVRELFGVFLTDDASLAEGVAFGRATFPFYAIYAVIEVISATLRGVGRASIPMFVIVFDFCVLRAIGVEIVMRTSPSSHAVAALYPITWAICASTLGAIYLYLSKKKDLE